MNSSLSNNAKTGANWLDASTPCLAQAHLRWADEAQLASFAQWLANRTGISQAYIALDGDLGAGKTTLVRHLLRALGVAGRIKSPTYTIMESYTMQTLPAPAPTPISHFDLYRFNDPQEWEEAGFRDVFASKGLKLVEWPEKAMGLLPQPDLLVQMISQADDSRVVCLKAFTPMACNLLPNSPSP